MNRLIIAVCLAFVTFVDARAAVLWVDYRQVAPVQWDVEFRLANSGLLPALTGFTVYFPHTEFQTMSLSASPVAWDSLVIQPDVALQSPGFLDSVLLNPAQPLLPGQSQGGFVARFEYLGAAPLPMLTFEIVDLEFNVLYSGTTSLVPEPTTAIILALGLVALGVRLRRRKLVARPCV